jgi:hypothetical protein
LSRAFDDQQTQLKSWVKKPRKKSVGFASDSERDWADLFRRGPARKKRIHQNRRQPLTLQMVVFLKEGKGVQKSNPSGLVRARPQK